MRSQAAGVISDQKQTQRQGFIRGTGLAVPERVLTNADLEKMVDTSDEWIRTRSGIRERRICADGENTADLAARAGSKALSEAGVEPIDVDLIILSTLALRCGDCRWSIESRTVRERARHRSREDVCYHRLHRSIDVRLVWRWGWCGATRARW